VQGLEADISPQRASLVGLEQPCRRAGAAREKAGPVGLPADHRLQQLADDTERERLLELGAPGLERQHPGLPGRRASLTRQHRLAHAGRPLDQEQRPVSGTGAVESLSQGLELDFTLKQGFSPDELHKSDDTRQACGIAAAKPGGKPWGILPCRADMSAAIMARVKSVSELNKLKVRLFVEAVLNEGRLDLIDELVAADYIGHVPCATAAVAGPEGVRRLVSSRRRAHPSLYIKIEDQIAEDDLVVTRWLATTAAPGGQPAAGCAGRIPCYAGISIIRLLAGKQVDSRTEYTRLTSDPAPQVSQER
jgi:predicted SnoaL-like aldol condensation-catalyzing enzyme